jgi:hypothetical protein
MIFDVLKDWKESKQFRLIGWLGILLLTIKLVMLFGIPIIPHAIEDWYIAKHIAEGSGYSLSNGPTALKTPVYPLFLSLPSFIGEFGKFFACGLQHILWFFASLFIYKASSIRFGSRFAFVASLLFALHPAYVYYPFVLESTALTVPLFILFWYLAEYSKLQSLNTKIPMLIGWLTALTQPILLPGILALQLFYFGKKRNVISLILTALVIFTPWTIRNAMTFDAFIPTKSPMWMNFYEGMQKDVTTQEQVHIESARRYMNDVELEKEYKAIVLRQFSENFPTYVNRSFHRFTEFWSLPDRYRNQMWTPAIIVSRILPQLLLGIGLFLSILMIIKMSNHLSIDDRHFLIILIGILIYVSIIYSLTQAANIRFKLDVEWLQILLLFPIFQGFPKLAGFQGTRE